MNKLDITRRAAVVRGLVEGGSIRSVARMTRTDKDTVMRILVEVGEFCSLYQHARLVNLPWTWTAICADSKLAVSWLVGERSRENAHEFVMDLATRLAGRVQLSTDGLPHYPIAIANAFGQNNVDYAQIRKYYGTTHEMRTKGPGRYSLPPVVIGVEKVAIFGEPDIAKISTSFVERQNLTMRMSMRRFTRLTNGFSKKAENHAHAVSMHFMFYNFCRSHTTLTKRANGVKTTPAMACGLTNHVWTVEHILEMMEPNYAIGASAA
jgi:IS1 family transposase